MSYSEHNDGVHYGEHEVAIFSKTKHKVTAHAKAPTLAEAKAKAKYIEHLHVAFEHMKGK